MPTHSEKPMSQKGDRAPLQPNGLALVRALLPHQGPVLALGQTGSGSAAEALHVAARLRCERSDVAVVAWATGGGPAGRGSFVWLDPIAGAHLEPGAMMRQWLRAGGVLLLVGAGGQQDRQAPRSVLAYASRMVVEADADLVPLFSDVLGRDGRPWAGAPIPGATLAPIAAAAQIDYLNLRLRALQWTAEHPWLPDPPGVETSTPVPRGPGSGELRAEVERLGPSARLVRGGGLEVVVAPARSMPAVMEEVGRLREVTFRQVSEGTGQARDLDRFDETYLHLVVWDPMAGDVVGAARLCQTERVLPMQGTAGLYTHTLFDFPAELFDRLGPSLEVGRSFIRPEYQRRSAALPLLWRGIGRFVARHPEYRHLFGPVSISRLYSPLAWHVIAAALDGDPEVGELASLVRPRSGLMIRRDNPVVDSVCRGALPFREALSDLVSDIEPDGKRLPVLLKHYLRLGGRMLAFNVDPAFGNCLDGLLVVDLATANHRMVDAYLGRAAAARFRAYHGTADPQLDAA